MMDEIDAAVNNAPSWDDNSPDLPLHCGRKRALPTRLGPEIDLPRGELVRLPEGGWLYHAGSEVPARSTLADANATRPWQVFGDLFGQFGCRLRIHKSGVVYPVGQQNDDLALDFLLFVIIESI